MKRHTRRLLSLLLSAVMLPLPQAIAAQDRAADVLPEYEIYPVPHSVVYPEDERSSFTVSDSVHVVYESGIDQYTKDYLEEILETNALQADFGDAVTSGKTNILIGTAASDEYVSSWFEDINLADDLFDKYDAYAIEVSHQQDTSVIAILGKDTDAAFYALSSLEYMFSSFEDNTLLDVSIQDYSNLELRGFIEGFYGEFTYPARASQMEFLRKVKGNMYVFASKSDPYHGGTQWRNLYPQEELDQIADLVSVGKKNKVCYVWSYHMGKSQFFASSTADPNGDAAQYAKYQEDLAIVQAKFQQLYDIGVRDFHILNDDYNTGTTQDICRFLNTMNQWLKDKGDCGPLVFCPKAYATYLDSGGELAGYKQYLDDDIDLYWTGSQVNSPLVQSDVDFCYNTSGHNIVNWINYPCSEHDKSGIYLGDISHYVSTADNLAHTHGIMSNPVNFPQANKVAYFQLMSWAWNNENYSQYTTELWENSFKYIEPEIADSYLKVARNVSTCADSYRYPEGFPESEYFKDALQSVQAKVTCGASLKNDEEVEDLLTEFDEILAAIADLKAHASADLLTDIDAWLNSLKEVVTSAKEGILAAMALEEADINNAWTHASAAASALGSWDSYTHPLFPEKKAKAGALRLMPFASAVSTWLSNQLMPILDPSYTGISPVVYTSFPSKSSISNLIDGDDSTYVDWSQQQVLDDYIGLDLQRLVTIHDVRIVQGKTDTDHDRIRQGTLETSSDGVHWTPIEENIDEQTIVRTGLSVTARYIRLRVTGFHNPNNPNKLDYWANFCEFSVNVNEGSPIQAFSDGDVLPAVSEEEQTVTLSGLAGNTLENGQALGVYFPDGEFISNAQAVNASGLSVEYSADGLTWRMPQTGEQVLASYVRLVNHAETPVSLDSSASLIITRARGTEPTVEAVNIASIKEGAWSNLLDGDLTSYVWTSVNQAAGQSIRIDLGRHIKADSLSLYMDENRPRLYHGTISVSDNGSDWSEVMIVDASNDITTIEGNMRKARCALDGSLIRYVSIDITDSAKEESSEHSAYLKLHELQINDASLPQEEASLFSTTSENSDPKLAGDRSLSTFFAPAEPSGSLEYIVNASHDAPSITFVQDATSISNASVEVLVEGTDSWQTIGSLDQAVTTLAAPENAKVARVRVAWSGSNPPLRLYEMMMSGMEAEPTVPVEPVTLVNLALNQPVECSGTEPGESQFAAALAVDGDKTTDSSRWSSNTMKSGSAAGQEQTPSWLMVDLGGNAEIYSVVVSYYRLVYATDFDIQVSDDAQTWTTVTSHTREASASLLGPSDTVEFEVPVKGRYLRFYCRAINHLAGGSCLGIRELEVMGVRKSSVDTEVLSAAVNAARALNLSVLDLSEEEKTEFDTLLADSEALLSSASQTEIDTQALGLGSALLALRLVPSANALSAL